MERRGPTALGRLFRRFRPHRDQGFVNPGVFDDIFAESPRSVRHLNFAIAELSELRAAIADNESCVTVLALNSQHGKASLAAELACLLDRESPAQRGSDAWILLARIYGYLALRPRRPDAAALYTTASPTAFDILLAACRLLAAFGDEEDAAQTVCLRAAALHAEDVFDLATDLYAGHQGVMTVSRPLTPELRAGLLRLIDGIRSVLCLMKIRVISGLSGDPPARHIAWVMLAPSRFGDRGDPDDHSLPAFMPMSVVAEAVRSV